MRMPTKPEPVPDARLSAAIQIVPGPSSSFTTEGDGPGTGFLGRGKPASGITRNGLPPADVATCAWASGKNESTHTGRAAARANGPSVVARIPAAQSGCDV